MIPYQDYVDKYKQVHGVGAKASIHTWDEFSDTVRSNIMSNLEKQLEEKNARLSRESPSLSTDYDVYLIGFREVHGDLGIPITKEDWLRISENTKRQVMICLAERSSFKHHEVKTTITVDKDAIPMYNVSTDNKTYAHSRYNDLVEKTVEEVLNLGVKKGGEYAGDDDRLANFRRNGKNLGLPMETVWAVYAGKHWDAIQQYIKDQRNGVSRERLEPISGRVDDMIVYLMLFKAMLDERGELDEKHTNP